MMTKVIARKEGKILVVLPYYSNGAYGTWELPRGTQDVQYVADIVQKSTGIQAQMSVAGVQERVMERGDNEKFVYATFPRGTGDWDEGKFHCSIDVTNPAYPGHKFPLFVKAQFVEPDKAVRMLKRSYGDMASRMLGLGEH